jgi:hypothetical protein
MSLRLWIDLFEEVESLQRKYAYYNKLLFDGALPRIPLSWAVMKNVGGVAHVKVIKDPSKKPPSKMEIRLGLKDKYADCMLVPDSLEIKLSSTFKRSDQATDAILIHEMIHVLNYINGHFGDPHGPAFTRELRRCGQIVGFPIPLTDSVRDLEVSDTLKDKVKSVGVILGKKRDDGYTYAIFNAEYLTAQTAMLTEKIEYLIRFNYWTAGWLYIVADAVWTAQSLKIPVQRKYASRFFLLPDTTVADDLFKNGTVLFEATKS